MATLIQNPDNVPGAVTTGYQLQNTVLFASMTGHNQVSLDADAGAVKQGSVFELNGSIARVHETEGIKGSITASEINYVYAVPDGNLVVFHFSTVAPRWSAPKGGWYREGSGERALLTVITDSSGNIAGTNLLTNAFDTLVPPNAGGVSAGEWNVRTHAAIHLNRGWYRYEITSGSGAGNGTNAGGGGSVGAGGSPSVSNVINGVFFHNGGGLIVHVGGDGFSGGNGTSASVGNNGGGGGSGAGEESYILSGSQKFSTENIRPGHGGAGTASRGGVGLLGDMVAGNPALSPGNGINGGASSIGGGGSAGGFGGEGGGAGSQNANGGSGGAPGWMRPLGDSDAGRVAIWRLS